MADQRKKNQFEQKKINNPLKFCMIITISLSGDVHINPGPLNTPARPAKRGLDPTKEPKIHKY